MTPETYSISRLAVEFGYDRRTIARRIGPVGPVRTEKRSKLYLLKDVAPLLVDFPGDDGLDFHGQRTRLTRLQADRIQREMEIEAGKYVLASDVVETWGSEYERVKNKLLAQPNRLAPQMLGHKNTAQPFEIIKAAIFEVLNELSAPDSDKEKHP